MNKFIIKATYLEGNCKGHYYFLTKGGFGVADIAAVPANIAYTLAACKSACMRKERALNAAIEFEKKQKERWLSEGKTVPPFPPLYVLQSFEPFAVNVIGE